MRANEAPEKIYVDSKVIGDNISTTIHTKPQDYPTCVEYTKTDVFIENVCSGIEKLLSGYIIRNFHFGDSYDIDRFIEDMKNYIKVG